MNAARRAYNFLNEMRTRDRAMLAFAVFLMFGTFGPIGELANSIVQTRSWTVLIVTTILSGSLSAGIILLGKQFSKRPWLMGVYMVVFLLLITKSTLLAEMISGMDESLPVSITESIQVSPEQFKTLHLQRLALFGLSASMIGFGWAMFAIVMNSEGRRRARLEAEISIAQRIQQSLLPQSSLVTPWCEIRGRSIPATEVGGDYYDMILLSEHQVAVVMADASGHGVGAGILSAMTKSALYSQLSQDPTPVSVLANLNSTLVRMTNNQTFVTCVYLLMDKKTKTIRASTAGHPPVFFKRASQSMVRDIRTPNLALGVKQGVRFKEESFRFSPGDSLLLYTDGIIESANGAKEEFGDQRLRRLFLELKGDEDIPTLMIERAKEFADGKEFHDDASVVSIRFL